MNAKPHETTTRSAHPNPSLDVVLLLLWFGILAGLVEVVALGTTKFFHLASAPAGWAAPGDRIRHGYLWLGLHVMWMAPVAMCALLLLPATILTALRRARPALITTSLVSGVFAFVCVASWLYLYPRLYDWAVLLLAGGVAVQIARVVGAREVRFRNFVRASARWLVLGLLVATAGSTGTGPLREKMKLAGLKSNESHYPNVLLLILDTVRAQNMSVYGYQPSTTPNLERLAERGVVFDRAIATSPWTLPSHVSIFTGRWPYEFTGNFLIPYGGEHVTLAEHLSQLGYVTAGFVGNLVYCTSEAGITPGFVHYQDHRISPSEFLVSIALGRRIARSQTLHRMLGNYDVLGAKDAKTVTREFLGWLESRPADRPFFAFINYMDAHEPYLPPQRFQEEFGTGTPRRNYLNQYFLRWAARPGRQTMTEAEIQAELAAYDGTIAYIDEQIGLVLEALDAKDITQETLVIVVADHGEQFGEHGLHVHGNSLFMPNLHVPMILSLPGTLPSGKRTAIPASIRDIPATVMDILGHSQDHPFAGTSLERYWSGSTDAGWQNTPILSQLTDIRGAPTMKSIVVGKYHYIWGENRFEALFDTEADPAELTSLMTRENIDLVTSMRRALAPHVRNDRELWERLPQSEIGR